LAKLLTRGSDLWLNNPRRPLEACGTSGMKAAMNGVLNLSVLDGWWAEACVHGVNGWQIGDGTVSEDADQQDEADLASLYRTLLEECCRLSAIARVGAHDAELHRYRQMDLLGRAYGARVLRRALRGAQRARVGRWVSRTFLSLLVLATTGCRAPPARPTLTPVWQLAQPGLWTAELALEGGVRGYAVRFDQSSFALSLSWAPTGLSVPDARPSDAAAIWNGGYFEQDMHPSGLLIDQGRQAAAPSNGSGLVVFNPREGRSA